MTNEENKAKLVDFKDGKLLIEKEFVLDPNKDGEPLGAVKIGMWLDISELPDEAISAYTKLKDKK